MLRLRALFLRRGPARTLPSAVGEGAWRRFLYSEARRGPAKCDYVLKTTPLNSLGPGRVKPHRYGSFGARLQTVSRRTFRTSAWTRSAKDGEAKANEKLSLGARLKKLSKEYGWSAVGVYLGLSILDFPFCFLLVRIVGTETIGKIENFITSAVVSIIPESIRNMGRDYWQSMKKAEVKRLGDDNISEKVEMAGWGVQEAHERNREEASLATQLALAYAIHKSFIFIRVPLTAAITPKVVKLLRSWGWKIGKRSP